MVISGYNNISTYCLYSLFFRQIENVAITDTDCSRFNMKVVLYYEPGFFADFPTNKLYFNLYSIYKFLLIKLYYIFNPAMYYCIIFIQQKIYYNSQYYTVLRQNGSIIKIVY